MASSGRASAQDAPAGAPDAPAGAPEEAEPTAEELAAAPPTHQASGRLRDHAQEDGTARRAARAVLWGPRQLLELGLWVPDMLAGRTDDYLESRGPNVFGRGEDTGGWSGSAMLGWEAPFGPSVGLRVGHSLGRRASADVTAVAFGRHGYTGRVGFNLEPQPDGPVGIDLDAELAYGRETAFAGIGDHELRDPDDAAVVIDPLAPGPVPEVIADDRALTIEAAVPVELGPFEVKPSARYERHELEPDDGAVFNDAYDRDALVGFEDPFALAVGRVEVEYDDRAAPYPWIPRSAPATGWRLRASAAYSIDGGVSAGAGDLRFARYGASAERLFDLFHGTRVLILRARFETITGDREDVPFVLLPALGGPDSMRAFSRGRFRDTTSTAGEVAYEWAVGLHARAALFVEGGGVHPAVDDIAADRLHLSAGTWFRLAFDGGTIARGVLAGSETGEFSFYLVLGGV